MVIRPWESSAARRAGGEDSRHDDAAVAALDAVTRAADGRIVLPRQDCGAAGLVLTDPATQAAALPSQAWTAHAAGEGAKGIRLRAWVRIALPWTVEAGFERWLQALRRNRRDVADRASDRA
jgi:hypothetical protein